MQHSFPRWLSYVLLAILVAAFGVFAETALDSGSIPGVIDYAVSLSGGAVFVLAAWGVLYTARYGVQVESEGISITGAFRSHTIPLSSIAQVITASAPRSGACTWLLDKDGACLAKLDGGLVGFEALLAELSEQLRSYHALFYRCETWGTWEMRVAGDNEWVQSEAPPLVRKTSRRLAKILAVGFLLIILAAGFVAWL